MAAAAIPLIAGTALAYVGSLRQADAIRAQGRRQAAAANYQAANLDTLAGQDKAAGQAAAAEAERQGALVNSSVLARAAASGGGASDPSVVALMKRNAGETWYRSALARFEGDEQSRVMSDKAMAARYSGQISDADSDVASKSMKVRAFATALSSFGTMGSSKYFSAPSMNSGASLSGGSGSFDPLQDEVT